MKKKIIDLYLFGTIKSPILSFGAIILFFSIFITVTSNTYIKQYEVLNADLKKTELLIDYNIHIEKGTQIYFYQEKSKYIYNLHVENLEIKDNKMIVKLDSEQLPIQNVKGYIEVPVSKTSLLNLIIKGNTNE